MPALLSMRRLCPAFLFASLLLAALPSLAATDDDATVRVMTRNLYWGSVSDAVVAAQTPQDLVAAAAQIYQAIVATKPAERAAAIAREIARNNVDLVGLQEAAIVRKGPFQLPPNPATFAPAATVVSDELQSILDALDDLGERYRVIAVVPGFDAQIPTALGFDARLTTRVAILARARHLSDIRLSNLQIQRDLTNSSFQTLAGPLTDTRGWASIDVEKNGRKFRFAATHLDIPIPVQASQAQDMINGAGHTDLPVVFVGDFNVVPDNNAAPSFPTYQKFINAGFSDAWKVRRPSEPGPTCCQATNILNPISQLSTRPDLVLVKGDIQVVDIARVGEKPNDRTPSGLWPSDHAGVVATLKIKRHGGQSH